jgi:hypothetical protein
MPPEENRRASQRSYSYAKLVFHDHNILGYVRDISARGIRAEIISDGNEQTREGVAITIIPDRELGLPPFNVEVDIRWSRSNGPTVSLGLQVRRFTSTKGRRIFSKLRRLFAAAS